MRNISLSKYTYDVMRSYLYHLYRVSGTTMPDNDEKYLGRFLGGM